MLCRILAHLWQAEDNLRRAKSNLRRAGDKLRRAEVAFGQRAVGTDGAGGIFSDTIKMNWK